MSQEIKYVANREGVILNIVFISLYCVLAILSILMAMHEIHMVSNLINNIVITIDDVAQMVSWRGMLSNITIIVYIACRSLFLNWVYYVQHNLRYFQIKNLKFDTWRLIFGFIIPVANFVLPILIVNDIWNASEPTTTNPEAYKTAPKQRCIILWWTLNLVWIFASVANNIAKVSAYHLNLIRILGYCTILTDILGIAVMLWTAYIVVAVYRRQQQKYKLYESEKALPYPNAKA